MVDIKKYSDINFYDLIEVEITATENTIRKAYRKKALACHPDKNPDNPRAAELFHELSKALEILSDKSARAAYDKILHAKKATELRNKQLDTKRQKLKLDLEERERLAHLQSQTSKQYSTVKKTDEQIFRDEIERLRKEGSKLLEEEQEIMRKQLLEEKFNLQKYAFDSSQHRIKIKWKADKNDKTNGGYSEDILRNFLMKYGDIVVLLMSPKKKGSALVEFKTQDAAEMAVSYEKGNLTNPLVLEWIGKAPLKKVGTSETITDSDYESLVLRQMRQAEERKRLIEQMMKEESKN